MGWFKEHLNLTFFFSWVVGNLLILWGRSIAPPDGSLAAAWLLLFLAAMVIILSTEIWYLRQKGRSLFNLFWNLLIYVGFIIILCLENNKEKLELTTNIEAEQVVQDGKAGISVFDILGIGSSATQEEVRAAYKEKANTAQLSKGGSIESAIEVNTAYDEICRLKGWVK
jgi:hypothetical protein